MILAVAKPRVTGASVLIVSPKTRSSEIIRTRNASPAPKVADVRMRMKKSLPARSLPSESGTDESVAAESVRVAR
ncbi:MAG: hypothetical protein A3I06_05865 [Candidatus Lindowbacteria bacterium RIFCSPLOWO2_02_FULL_62_12]|nr:MAG: hypothetical protein A3I06_05865 [Candidatus Lindowbacteria bacterium RIFCSPLOWO2_02_FULL_62_12]